MTFLLVVSIFWFSPLLWGDDTIWQAYFQDDLKAPTMTSGIFFHSVSRFITEYHLDRRKNKHHHAEAVVNKIPENATVSWAKHLLLWALLLWSFGRFRVILLLDYYYVVFDTVDVFGISEPSIVSLETSYECLRIIWDQLISILKAFLACSKV